MAISLNRTACKKTCSQNLNTRSLPAGGGAGQFLTVLARNLKWIAALVIVTVLSWVPAFAMGQGGQAPSEQGTVSAPASPAPPPVGATVKEILTGSVKVSSPEVQVQGVFKGWKGTCPTSTLLTRSDWVLEDETGCIHVSGLLPPGLSPARPNNERVMVTGRVVRSKGSLVLKATVVTKTANDR